MSKSLPQFFKFNSLNSFAAKLLNFSNEVLDILLLAEPLAR